MASSKKGGEYTPRIILVFLVSQILLVAMLSFVHSREATSLENLTPAGNATDTENPGDFFSALGFVTQNDRLLYAILTSWIIGLALLLWKISFGSLGAFFHQTMGASYDEAYEETMSRARLLYKMLATFFAALFLSSISTPFFYEIFGYGGFFFIVLWLTQVNHRDARNQESFKNRILGLIGLLFATLCLLLFGANVYFNGSALATQSLGMFLSRGIWSASLAVLALVGFAGIFIILALLMISSFELLKDGYRV